MVGKNLWQSLKRLAEYDETITDIQKNIDALKEEQCTHLYAIEDLEDDLLETQKACNTEEKNVELQELYAKELEERHDLLKEKLPTITNKKEVDAIEREMNDLVRKHRVHENVLMKSIQNRDLAFKQLEMLKKSIEEQGQEAKKNVADADQKISELTKELHDLQAQRIDVLQKLDDEWKKRYERVKQTVKDPIVPLVQNCCSACFYLVASKDLVELKKNHIIICRNCYRFIYCEEVVAVPPVST